MTSWFQNTRETLVFAPKKCIGTIHANCTYTFSSQLSLYACSFLIFVFDFCLNPFIYRLKKMGRRQEWFSFSFPMFCYRWIHLNWLSFAKALTLFLRTLSAYAYDVRTNIEREKTIVEVNNKFCNKYAWLTCSVKSQNLYQRLILEHMIIK